MILNKKLPIQRLMKFGFVGGLATGVHLAVLLLLVRLARLATGPSNLVAFVMAFLLSNTLQQHFTFSDRMAGQSLKKRSVLVLFCVNATAAYGLGAVAKGLWIPVLAFVPPVLNYTLLHFFSGHPRFKR